MIPFYVLGLSTASIGRIHVHTDFTNKIHTFKSKFGSGSLENSSNYLTWQRFRGESENVLFVCFLSFMRYLCGSFLYGIPL